MISGDKILTINEEIITPTENSEDLSKKLEEHFKDVLECMGEMKSEEGSEDDILEGIENV